VRQVKISISNFTLFSDLAKFNILVIHIFGIAFGIFGTTSSSMINGVVSLSKNSAHFDVISHSAL